MGGQSVYQLSTSLLARFQTLDGLLQQPVATLHNIEGLGMAKIARLKAARELSLRVAEERMENATVFADAVSVSRYIQQQIGSAQREVFGCLFLDSRHRLLAWEALFFGSIDKAHVHAREIVRRALELNAAAIVFGHNHPSGVAEPSQADVQLTADLGDLLRRMEVRLLDHIVVARSDSVSMAQRGLMSPA